MTINLNKIRYFVGLGDKGGRSGTYKMGWDSKRSIP